MKVTLYAQLSEVLASDWPLASTSPALESLAALSPVDRTDRFLSLLEIYDLTMTPLSEIGAAARWAEHPVIAGLKLRLETEWLAELDSDSLDAGSLDNNCTAPFDEDPVRAIRTLAAKDRLPRVYRWVGAQATLAELRQFLAIEGGPDGGFDDLVARCQVGLDGAPKMELARNYWDEMGNGTPAAVHTDLHRQMAAALKLPDLPRTELPEAALERAALGGLLATNRWLQPEMIGALGLTELQAGPRCRLVLTAFQRLGVARDAHTFYEVHADVDPRHGKDWLEQAVAPLAANGTQWRARMIRGARWRWQVNAGLFDTLELGQGAPGQTAPDQTVAQAA